jgi:hypothetical protein
VAENCGAYAPRGWLVYRMFRKPFTNRLFSVPCEVLRASKSFGQDGYRFSLYVRLSSGRIVSMSMPIASHEVEPDPEPIRARLRAMSDRELLQHGRRCAAACDPYRSQNITPAGLLELRECCLDWLRRRQTRRNR